MNDSATAQELEQAHELTRSDVSAAMYLIDEALKMVRDKVKSVPASRRTPAEVIVNHAMSNLYTAHSQLHDASCTVGGLPLR